jgi:hypothetical protein
MMTLSERRRSFYFDTVAAEQIKHPNFIICSYLIVENRRLDSQSQATKISLIGVRLSFRGQLDEICPHSVSDLRTL